MCPEKAFDAEDRLGQAHFIEQSPKHRPDRAGGDIAQRAEAQAIARVIVQHGQGHDALAGDFDRTFVIQLPQFVGRSAFEGLSGNRHGRGRWWIDASTPLEDRRHGADRRHRALR
jgi:hypothetical protein